jgi:hypothetical protein
MWIRRTADSHGSVIRMNIVYNSNHYHVVEYPGRNGYELIDKTLGVTGYMEGEMAESFRESLQKIIDEDPTIDVVDEFLGGFESLMTQPVRFH